jgi:hypothetical protein
MAVEKSRKDACQNEQRGAYLAIKRNLFTESKINSMSSKIVLSARLFAISILITMSSFSQENVSGTWILESKQHMAGPNYANSMVKQVSIFQQNDSLVFESVHVDGSRNEVVSKHSLPLNGQSLTSNTKANRKLIETLQWNKDKQTGFVITRVYYRTESPSEIDFTRVETWSFSSDAKQLTIDKKSIETRSQDWHVKGLFNKKL